jgi:PTS system mannitol-specific IIC component
VGGILNAGLVGPPAPGSIFAYFSMTPKGGGGWFDTIAVVTTGAVVSFAVASALMGFGRGEKDAEVTLPEDNVLVGD